MNQEKWQQAKELFHQARDLPVKDRAALLDRACAGDRSLREQVDNLLGAYESGFMEDSVVQKVAEIIGGENEFKEGQVIGRYQIKRSIGVGGMGEVFLADDTELDRPVAFKFLHRDVAEDPERVRRFIQEARAAAALNHPNILNIHEIGSFEGANYIVSEFINGETLRERMHLGLTVAESLDVAAQVAAALQAAHEAGIVHRDIKPENIMIRRDRLVKVLDFGLAKLVELRNADRGLRIEEEVATLMHSPQNNPQSTIANPQLTSPGLVMGTAAYMSPEQAKGQAVDARTDLWSLGVVLHEMLTGKSPFEGETVTELITSILKTDTPTFDPDKLPQDLQSICRKALTRDKHARYQSSQEFIQDLQGEKKKMENAIHSDRFISVSSTDDDQKTQLIRRRPTLSAEYVVSGIKRHKYATLSAIAMIVIAGISLTVYKYNGATPPVPGLNVAAITDSTVESDLKISKLPISGQTEDIAISPDGKYVAYGTDKGIRLLERSTSAETEILSEGEVWDLSFSHDGQFVYYYDGNDVMANIKPQLMRLSIRGGKPMKVADDPVDAPSSSPDGAMIVYTRKIRGGADGVAIILANPDGSNERTLATTSPANPNFRRPVFSPDGKTVACISFLKKDNGGYKLVGFSVADGMEQSISEKRWEHIWAAIWLPNGNFVVTAREKYSEPSQLWSIPLGGEPRALTSGLVNYRGLSATRTGDVLVATQVTDIDTRDLWVYQENASKKGRQVTTSGEVRGRIALTPDGRIVMGSDVSGDREIWIMNADGGGRKQLTHDPGGDVQPTVSLDGKYIAFTSNRVNGVDHIFRMDIDGGNLKQLTKGKQKALPSFSPDGKWVYFVEPPSNTIWKVSADGGEPALVATAPDDWQLFGIDINKTDGRLVYGLVRGKGSQRKLVILTTKGAVKLIDIPANNFNVERPRWAPDNRTIALISYGTGDIWSIPVDGKGKPRQLTDFRTPTFDPRWTADGKELFVTRGAFSSNPVLIQNTGN